MTAGRIPVAAPLSNDRGATLIEFAIVLPILVLLIFGIVEFSRAYNTKVTLTHAARESVRVMAVEDDAAKAQTAAKDAVSGTLDPDQLTWSATACTPGDPVQVNLTYPFSYDIPLFGSRSMDMSAVGVMRCGG